MSERLRIGVGPHSRPPWAARGPCIGQAWWKDKGSDGKALVLLVLRSSSGSSKTPSVVRIRMSLKQTLKRCVCILQPRLKRTPDLRFVSIVRGSLLSVSPATTSEQEGNWAGHRRGPRKLGSRTQQGVRGTDFCQRSPPRAPLALLRTRRTRREAATRTWRLYSAGHCGTQQFSKIRCSYSEKRGADSVFLVSSCQDRLPSAQHFHSLLRFISCSTPSFLPNYLVRL